MDCSRGACCDYGARLGADDSRCARHGPRCVLPNGLARHRSVECRNVAAIIFYVGGNDGSHDGSFRLADDHDVHNGSAQTARPGTAIRADRNFFGRLFVRMDDFQRICRCGAVDFTRQGINHADDDLKQFDFGWNYFGRSRNLSIHAVEKRLP